MTQLQLTSIQCVITCSFMELYVILYNSVKFSPIIRNVIRKYIKSYEKYINNFNSLFNEEF